jgi:hypothetical protein
VRVAAAIGVVGAIIASAVWGFDVGVVVAIGAAIGLLFGAFRRALTEPVEDRIERYRSRNDQQP